MMNTYHTVSLIISVISVLFAYSANSKAKAANRISQTGVKKADEANKISEKANDTAARSLEVSKRENITRFAIDIIDIRWDNGGFSSDTIDDALMFGVVKCNFKIENLSTNKALFVGFNKNYSELRADGVHIRGESFQRIESSFKLYKLLSKEPIYDEVALQKKEYEYEAPLYWDNGVYSCSCKVAFTIGFKIGFEEEIKRINTYLTNIKECETYDYKIEEIFK